MFDCQPDQRFVAFSRRGKARRHTPPIRAARAEYTTAYAGAYTLESVVLVRHSCGNIWMRLFSPSYFSGRHQELQCRLNFQWTDFRIMLRFAVFRLRRGFKNQRQCQRLRYAPKTAFGYLLLPKLLLKRQALDDAFRFFKIPVLAQDCAAVTQVGADVEQVVRLLPMQFFQNGITCISRAPPTPLIAYWRNALSISISPNTLCVVQTLLVAFVLDVDPAACAAFSSSGMSLAKRADMADNQRRATLPDCRTPARRIDAADRTPYHGSYVLLVGCFFTLRARRACCGLINNALVGYTTGGGVVD